MRLDTITFNVNGNPATMGADGMWYWDADVVAASDELAALRAENERLKAALVEADGDKMAMALKIRDLEAKQTAIGKFNDFVGRLVERPLCVHDQAPGECKHCQAEHLMHCLKAGIVSEEEMNRMGYAVKLPNGVTMCGTPLLPENQICSHGHGGWDCLDCHLEERRKLEEHIASLKPEVVTLPEIPAPLHSAETRCSACGDVTNHVPNGMWCRGKA